MKLFNLFPLRLIKGAIFFNIFKSCQNPLRDHQEKFTISSTRQKTFVRALHWVGDHKDFQAGAMH